MKTINGETWCQSHLADQELMGIDQAVADARGLLPLSVAWLGFNIATGIFGSKALGALGNTSEGPHSDIIRNRLSTDGQKGFKAAVAFHLKKAA